MFLLIRISSYLTKVKQITNYLVQHLIDSLGISRLGTFSFSSETDEFCDFGHNIKTLFSSIFCVSNDGM